MPSAYYNGDLYYTLRLYLDSQYGDANAFPVDLVIFRNVTGGTYRYKLSSRLGKKSNTGKCK